MSPENGFCKAVENRPHVLAGLGACEEVGCAERGYSRVEVVPLVDCLRFPQEICFVHGANRREGACYRVDRLDPVPEPFDCWKTKDITHRDHPLGSPEEGLQKTSGDVSLALPRPPPVLVPTEREGGPGCPEPLSCHRSKTQG